MQVQNTTLSHINSLVAEQSQFTLVAMTLFSLITTCDCDFKLTMLSRPAAFLHCNVAFIGVCFYILGVMMKMTELY